MADVQLQDSNHFSITVNKLEKNNEIDCQHCEELKADIQKAKQYISSYREIIKILLEEQTTPQQQQPGTDKLKREEAFIYPIRTSMKTTLRAGIRQSNLIQVTQLIINLRC